MEALQKAASGLVTIDSRDSISLLRGTGYAGGKEDHERLIEHAVAGDRLSTGRLLLSHASALSRFIAARLPADVGTVASAEDVLQDTFVAAFRDIGRFTPRDGGTFAGWLTTIAERQVLCTLDRMRAQKRGGRRRNVRPAGQRPAR